MAKVRSLRSPHTSIGNRRPGFAPTTQPHYITPAFGNASSLFWVNYRSRRIIIKNPTNTRPACDSMKLLLSSIDDTQSQWIFLLIIDQRPFFEMHKRFLEILWSIIKVFRGKFSEVHSELDESFLGFPLAFDTLFWKTIKNNFVKNNFRK